MTAKGDSLYNIRKYCRTCQKHKPPITLYCDDCGRKLAIRPRTKKKFGVSEGY